eukprot:TRINITY_DN60780_c0_g1_i1.p1 TRINITY_DN60780_c0_g1~~TRINITY_DN60780_c0_g1_i1.p1  ORF type:complete len:614 (+),score=26.36 TRINITY_DN60780_c0_g1_i1:53-1894(+)
MSDDCLFLTQLWGWVCNVPKRSKETTSGEHQTANTQKSTQNEQLRSTPPVSFVPKLDPDRNTCTTEGSDNEEEVLSKSPRKSDGSNSTTPVAATSMSPITVLSSCSSLSEPAETTPYHMVATDQTVIGVLIFVEGEWDLCTVWQHVVQHCNQTRALQTHPSYLLPSTTTTSGESGSSSASGSSSGSGWVIVFDNTDKTFLQIAMQSLNSTAQITITIPTLIPVTFPNHHHDHHGCAINNGLPTTATTCQQQCNERIPKENQTPLGMVLRTATMGPMVLLSYLGEGYNAYVGMVEDCTGNRFAVKIAWSSHDAPALRCESKLHRKLCNKGLHSIPKWYDNSHPTASVVTFFVMELLQGDSLLDYVFSSTEEMFNIYLKANQAVEELHSLGYMHNDLKIDNFMVLNNTGHANNDNGSPTTQLQVKLVDMGSCGLAKKVLKGTQHTRNHSRRLYPQIPPCILPKAPDKWNRLAANINNVENWSLRLVLEDMCGRLRHMSGLQLTADEKHVVSSVSSMLVANHKEGKAQNRKDQCFLVQLGGKSSQWNPRDPIVCDCGCPTNRHSLPVVDNFLQAEILRLDINQWLPKRETDRRRQIELDEQRAVAEIAHHFLVTKS